jgi:hypothetical protein
LLDPERSNKIYLQKLPGARTSKSDPMPGGLADYQNISIMGVIIGQYENQTQLSSVNVE